jgi:biopolymer transport protein ExbD
MLVLLIMLIITLPIQTHAVKIDMPKALPTEPEIPPEVVTINVDFDGSVYWNGNLVARPDDPASYATLNGYLMNIGKQGIEMQPEIHLSAHRLVIYDHVARVLASAQRLGAIKIGLVGSEEFMQ